MSTFSKYTLFAIFSIGVNLLFQYLALQLYNQLYFGMFVGTLAGLVAKYILDKKFIFYHETKSKKEEGKNFMLYSLMGVFTTIIFWGSEIAFDYFLGGEISKYIGAVIGLAIGYVVKYNLDKKYVFVTKE